METKYFKNKVTKQIAEYDSVIGLFYIIGDNKYKPISSVTIQCDPNWEQYTPTNDEIQTEDKATIMRNRFFSWLNIK